MYNYEHYEDLVKRYISDENADALAKAYLLGSEIKKYSDSIEMTLDEWGEEELYHYYVDNRNIANTTIYNSLHVQSLFYDYLIRHHIRSNNPCDSAIVKPKNLIESMKLNPQYYTDKDIEVIAERITLNKSINEGLVRTYYEGVALTTTDVMDLKYSGVDFKNHTIEIPLGKKNISPRLTELYADFKSLDYIVGDAIFASRTLTRKTPLMFINQDQLFPTTGVNAKTFLSRRLSNISDNTLYELHPSNLYYSGFLNYIVRDIGIVECLQIVLENGRHDHAKLEQYANDYLFRHISNKIRTVLRRMAIAMRDKES